MDQVHCTHLEGINSESFLDRALEDSVSHVPVRANYYIPLHHEVDPRYYD